MSGNVGGDLRKGSRKIPGRRQTRARDIPEADDADAAEKPFAEVSLDSGFGHQQMSAAASASRILACLPRDPVQL